MREPAIFFNPIKSSCKIGFLPPWATALLSGSVKAFNFFAYRATFFYTFR